MLAICLIILTFVASIVNAMVAKLKDVDPRALYSPKEAWTLLGISKAALYRYDSLGLIEHDIRLANGRRVYRGYELIRFHGAIA